MIFNFASSKTAISQVGRQVRSMSSQTTRRVLSSSKTFPTLGLLAGITGFYLYSTSSRVQAESKALLTGNNEFVDVKLKESKELSGNAKAFIFEIPKDHVLGLHTASAILTKFVNSNGKNVLRPYTPVSDVDTTGFFELVIKRYEGGAMSNHIFNLGVGDTLAIKGPLPKYKWEPNLHKEIALLAGGTGITPMYQLLHEISRKPEDKTKVTLFYASVSPQDILLKKEIDDIVAKEPDQFKVHYFVDKPSNDWKENVGFITKDYLQKNLFPANAENVKVFVCGPPPFYDAISGNKISPQDQGQLVGALKDLGFDKEQVFKF